MLTFRAGEPGRPRGHAFLYFRDADEAGSVWATYLVVPPIALDLGKYMPAMFAQQMAAHLTTQENVSYPLPPLPEKVAGGLEWLDRLAALRGDDVLDGGTIRAADPLQLMHPLTEVGREYAEAYKQAAAQADAPTLPSEADPRPATTDADVDDLLLQVLPDREKVERLARLVGTLRYAIDGQDDALAGETAEQMTRIGRRLGEKYRVSELIEAGQRRSPEGGALAELYVERCYRLADEDYGVIAEIDRKISAHYPTTG